jgi:hypothetical protein
MFLRVVGLIHGDVSGTLIDPARQCRRILEEAAAEQLGRRMVAVGRIPGESTWVPLMCGRFARGHPSVLGTRRCARCSASIGRCGRISLVRRIRICQRCCCCCDKYDHTISFTISHSSGNKRHLVIEPQVWRLARALCARRRNLGSERCAHGHTLGPPPVVGTDREIKLAVNVCDAAAVTSVSCASCTPTDAVLLDCCAARRLLRPMPIYDGAEFSTKQFVRSFQP